MSGVIKSVNSFLFKDKTSQSSGGSQQVAPQTEAEQRLTDVSVEGAEQRADLVSQFPDQLAELMAGLNSEIDKMSAATQQAFEDFGGNFELLGESINQSRQIIGASFEATPEQKALIQRATDAAIATGTEDINIQSRQALQDIRDVFVDERGLRATDTPVLDRAGRVGARATEQVGQLTRQLRGQQIQQELNLPLAHLSALNQTTQQGVGTAQFAQSLRQNAFNNRLQAANFRTGANLGLLGQSPTGTQALSTLTQRGLSSFSFSGAQRGSSTPSGLTRLTNLATGVANTPGFGL